MAAERDEVGVACRNNGRGTLTVESAGSDQGATEFLPQQLRGDRSLAVCTGNLSSGVVVMKSAQDGA